MNGKKNSGFTLVEIMIVVMIIGILLAVAVPNLLAARQNAAAKSCIGNMRQVLHAKQMFSMENGISKSQEVTWDDIKPYLRGDQPSCPMGGTYDLLTVSETVTCNRTGHVLQ